MNPNVCIKPITILGAGYVGRELVRRFPAAIYTRRHPISSSGAVAFDLNDEQTWDIPPLAGRQVVWTFPATPLDAVQTFYEKHLKDAAGLIVLGSTSAYLVDESSVLSVVNITEQSPLDLTQPRVQGEEWLRCQGALVLQLAGIFGPGRNPVDWLKRGLIRDGAKIVNLIHVDDIVTVIAHLLTLPWSGKRINLSNGETLAWRELVLRFCGDGRLPSGFVLAETGSHTYGKCIDNNLICELLHQHHFICA